MLWRKAYSPHTIELASFPSWRGVSLLGENMVVSPRALQVGATELGAVLHIRTWRQLCHGEFGGAVPVVAWLFGPFDPEEVKLLIPASEHGLTVLCPDPPLEVRAPMFGLAGTLGCVGLPNEDVWGKMADRLR
ncbi:MAG: hypothetical protein JNM85_06715 [Chthonomonas sp.]|nr:hypothetical protein [Chthonomonas sp.]